MADAGVSVRAPADAGRVRGGCGHAGPGPRPDIGGRAFAEVIADVVAEVLAEVAAEVPAVVPDGPPAGAATVRPAGRAVGVVPASLRTFLT